MAAIEAFANDIGLSAAMPFLGAAFSGNFRYFWIYALTGLALSALVAARRGPARESAQRLFSRETLASVSARNDYVIVAVNSVLVGTVLSVLFIDPAAVTDGVVAAARGLGVAGDTTGPAALAAAGALTVALFLIKDFCFFLAHTLLHKVPELWEIHKVHHSAEELNFFTSERFHPGEIVFTSLLTVPTLAAVNGLFIAGFGDALTPATLFGANILLFAFNLFGGVLRHSPVWFSFGPGLERWFVSPAMHQIHHSGDPRHYDMNMGWTLAVWDRMFGSWFPATDYERLGFGIGAETADFRDLGVVYGRPLMRAARLFAGRFRSAPRAAPAADA